MTTVNISQAIRTATARTDLQREDAALVMLSILEGKWTLPQTAAWLTAMAAKGETMPELLGCYDALMRKCGVLRGYVEIAETCAIGGDHGETFNASLAAALMASAGGVAVARMEQAPPDRDLLLQLGVRTDLQPDEAPAWLDEARFAFFRADAYLPALGVLGPVRQELVIPTLLDVLLPLCNPARAGRLVLCVARREQLPVQIELLQRLGVTRAVLLHDRGIFSGTSSELGPAGPIDVWELFYGKVRRSVVELSALGLHPYRLRDLRGGPPEAEARSLREIFRGARGPLRDVCLLHTAALLWIGDRARGLREGIDAAADLIDFGTAAAKLDQLSARSRMPRRRLEVALHGGS